MNPTIESLNYDEFKIIYHDMMVHDFPKNELRPLFMFRSLFRKGVFTCLVMKEKTTILAYACVITNGTSSLLDYFAVNAEMRGNGVGSVFLKELKNYIATDGIIIESELPYKAKDDTDRRVREKRVAFYERNGASVSDYEWSAFGVDYHLLWYPFSDKKLDHELGPDMKGLYGKAMPHIVVSMFTKLSKV